MNRFLLRNKPQCVLKDVSLPPLCPRPPNPSRALLSNPQVIPTLCVFHTITQRHVPPFPFLYTFWPLNDTSLSISQLRVQYSTVWTQPFLQLLAIVWTCRWLSIFCSFTKAISNPVHLCSVLLRRIFRGRSWERDRCPRTQSCMKCW